MEKKYLVAVKQDKNGKCLKVCKVVNVNEKRYCELKNEENEEIAKNEREKAELLETIKSLQEDISLLKCEIKCLKGEDNDEEE